MDAYAKFFNRLSISKSDFFDFGLSETIYAPLDKAEKFWEELKANIRNNEKVYIRGFGRNGNGTSLYQDLYRNVLGIENVYPDVTNNHIPTKALSGLTGYSKQIKSGFTTIQNYQVSHVFGRTKNVYAFTAPWNIVYIPKMLDPFTGHEAKGQMVEEFQRLFQKKTYEHFRGLIEDFNNIMTIEISKKILSYTETTSIEPKLKKSIAFEFSPISV